MAINKVEFGDQTLIDLTNDTVTQQDVLNGKTFHSADGVVRSGSATIPSALNDLTDVDITSPSNGQVLKYDASNNEWVNSNEGTVEIIPNPVDTPTTQLNSLGFYGTEVVTILDNGLVSTNSAYAWASYRTALINGVTYDLKLTDSFYSSTPIYSSFTWQGSTIVLTLGDRKELTIEETRAGLTYYPGAWRQHYLDIKSQIQSTIYKVGNVSDNPTFTEAQTRANIASGESFATILGKIKKWFSDLASMFVSKSGDTINGDLTVTGDLVAPYAYVDTLNYHDSITDKSLNITKPQTISTGGTIQVPDKGGTMALTSDIPVDDVEVNGVSVVDTNKIAKIKSYKEVTRTEYEALPDTKLNDGIAYFITDGSSAKVQGYPPLIYSLEEREVGVWHDGKPLYQKTLVNNSTNASGSLITIDVSALNIDTCVSMNGICDRIVPNTGTLIYDMNTWETNQLYTCLAHSKFSGNIQYYIRFYNNESTSWQVITIQYTKTTDTAGSGIWNGQGGIAHHYSTNETVIGTWIDGKPLYEITAEFSTELTVNSNTFTNTTISATDKKAIISVVGINSTGTCWNMLSANCDNGSYIQVYHTRSSGITLKYLTIQYTKTTDV